MIARIIQGEEALLALFVAVARRDPGVTTEQTILVSAVFFVLVVMVLLVLFTFLAPRKRVLVRRRLVADVDAAQGAQPKDGHASSGTDTANESDVRQRRSISRFLVSTPVLVLLAGGIVAASYGVSGTNSFCVRYCHQDMAPVMVVKSDAPAPLTATVIATEAIAAAVPTESFHERCASCHSSDPLSDVIDRSRMLIVTALGATDASLTAVVDGDRCLVCHRTVLSELVADPANQVVMSHAEPHSSGINCVRCHVRIGHEGSVAPGMSSCVECHDGQEAASQCSTCHRKPDTRPSDIVSTGRAEGSRGKRRYALVGLDSSRCYGCHAPLPCDSCHRVRLPHTVQFLDGGHAYRAAWSGKDRLCFRCHSPAECQDCHLSFAFGGHYDGWERDHVYTSPTASCRCHDTRNPRRTEPFCTVCH